MESEGFQGLVLRVSGSRVEGLRVWGLGFKGLGLRF